MGGGAAGGAAGGTAGVAAGAVELACGRPAAGAVGAVGGKFVDAGSAGAGACETIVGMAVGRGPAPIAIAGGLFWSTGTVSEVPGVSTFARGLPVGSSAALHATEHINKTSQYLRDFTSLVVGVAAARSKQAIAVVAFRYRLYRSAPQV